MIPEDMFDKAIAEFEKNGCFFVKDADDKKTLRETLFAGGVANKDVIGQDIATIASLAGIKIPKDTKVLVVETDGIGKADLFCKEKMCPVLAVIKYKDFSQAVSFAQVNLDFEGKGHSVSIHSNNKQNIEYTADKLKVSRFLINQICATANGGSFFNGLAATTTLGCGSWGNNSISENLDYRHLINISRIAYYKKDALVPSDEELWGEV
jgi:succinate-semialdehyde dehydrogenase